MLHLPNPNAKHAYPSIIILYVCSFFAFLVMTIGMCTSPTMHCISLVIVCCILCLVCVCIFSDTSLTCQGVLTTLETVNDPSYEKLGDILKTPIPMRKKIKSQCTKDEERRKGMIQYYISTCPYASWGHLAAKLLYHEEYEALDKVKKKIKVHEGKDMCWIYYTGVPGRTILIILTS